MRLVEAVDESSIGTPLCVSISSLGATYIAYESAENGVGWRFRPVAESMRPDKSWGPGWETTSLVGFNRVRESEQSLKEWLEENVVTAEDIRTTRVALGPWGRHFAWTSTSGGAYSWTAWGYPELFIAEIREGLYPEAVTFGSGKSWAVVWSDGSHSIDLDDKYPELSQVLDDHERLEIQVRPCLRCSWTSIDLFR